MPPAPVPAWTNTAFLDLRSRSLLTKTLRSRRPSCSKKSSNLNNKGLFRPSMKKVMEEEKKKKKKKSMKKKTMTLLRRA